MNHTPADPGPDHIPAAAELAIDLRAAARGLLRLVHVLTRPDSDSDAVYDAAATAENAMWPLKSLVIDTGPELEPRALADELRADPVTAALLGMAEWLADTTTPTDTDPEAPLPDHLEPFVVADDDRPEHPAGGWQ
ncbi:hypothetical protein [Nocardia sp. CC201C]|uniref:hypothetical protein n=1 Tax=Nocardia sp. CC201C TaxID=3044575 RepID=UPI0024A8D11B|nr:hypothetical protein [Nocardia sp. CC201C]